MTSCGPYIFPEIFADLPVLKKIPVSHTSVEREGSEGGSLGSDAA